MTKPRSAKRTVKAWAVVGAGNGRVATWNGVPVFRSTERQAQASAALFSEAEVVPCAITYTLPLRAKRRKK